MTKENKRLSLISIIFTAVIVLAGASPWIFPKIDPNLALAIIGGCATLYFSLNKHWIEGDRMFRELFKEFTERFNNMNEDLNKIKEGAPLSKDGRSEGDVIQDYLNLCSEEYLWYKRGRIDPEVWKAWERGIAYYLSGSAKIRKFFEQESQYNESYYGLFDKLKAFKKTISEEKK